MAKRSKKQQIDILTETQHNSRWFLGRRSYTAVSDKTDAEWSWLRRNLFTRHRANHILSVIMILACGISLTAGCISTIQYQGWIVPAAAFAVIVVLTWGLIYLYIKRLLPKQ